MIIYNPATGGFIHPDRYDLIAARADGEAKGRDAETGQWDRLGIGYDDLQARMTKAAAYVERLDVYDQKETL